MWNDQNNFTFFTLLVIICITYLIMQVVNFLGFKVKIFILIQQILRTCHVPGTIENNTIFTLKELIAQLEHIFLSSSA